MNGAALRNGRMERPGRVLTGSLKVADGAIAAIDGSPGGPDEDFERLCDVALVRVHDDMPAIRGAWRQGVRVS